MNESKETILKMLQDGSITVEEADRMLLAVGNTERLGAEVDEVSEGSDDALSSPDDIAVADAMPLPDTAPDFDALRSSWTRPFGVVLAVMTAFFILATALLRQTRVARKLGGVLLLSGALLAGLVATYIWSSRDGLWLHVRVQSDDGNHFRISLPLSTRLVRWGTQMSREYADEKTLQYLDIIDELLTAWESDPNQDPVFIDVDEGGDKVQVYIG